MENPLHVPQLKKEGCSFPQKSSGKSFSGSVLLMWESFFRWTTQYSKSKKIRFISVGKPLISGPKLRHCPGKCKTRNPFAHFPPQWTPHRKTIPNAKNNPDLRVQWNLWKTARCGNTGCHGKFHVLRFFQKTRSWFELPSDPSSGWIPNWKIKKTSLLTLLNLVDFGNSSKCGMEKAMISGPEFGPLVGWDFPATLGGFSQLNYH